jgi:hypothetical protein
MTEIDQRYIDLYVQKRRLMTLGWRKHEEDINVLDLEINALRATGDVSEKAIKWAPHVPWR